MAGATVTAIQKAGVVGAGGGGFPTHIKAAAGADIVLANGAECEPLLRADTELMSRDAERVVRGLSIVRDSVGAGRAVIALKKKNARALNAIAGALSSDSGVELLPLSNVYPAGDEFLLVFEATGRVVPEGGIPLDVGVIVNNVTTLAQVTDAVEGRPVSEKMVTVQGEVVAPGTFVTPIGTSINELIASAGGATCEDSAVVIGGPMMGHLMLDGGQPTTKTVAGVIVLPADHRLVSSMSSREAQVLRLARAACCQCMACTELCPRALLGHGLEPHRTVRAIQYAEFPEDHRHITSAYLCCECGMCELFACPLGIQPRRILADLKAELVRRGVPNPHRRTDLSPDDVREYRQIPTARLTRRLGLERYDVDAPLRPEPLCPSRVTLRMKQHVGEPAVPVVTPGQTVLKGDVVGEAAEDVVSARVHASISGVVESASEDAVVIASADA
ncbi:MAG: 4Fe-4S dicluster domain-containing protein [Candidatus Eisenbacteria bacterium]